MEMYFVGLLVMMLCLWYSKIMIQKALYLLDDTKKALLLTLFQTENKYRGLITILVLGVYFLVIQFTTISLPVLMILLFVYLMAMFFYNFRVKVAKLSKHDFPMEYIKQFKMAAMVQIIGILALFASSLCIL